MTSANSHHTMFKMEVDGVTTLITRISHGTAEISDSNLRKMAKQCALHSAEFLNLVDCPLTAESWEALVRERCAGGRNPFMPNR